MSNVVQLRPNSNIQMSKEVKCVRHTNDPTNESLPIKQKPLQTLNEIIFFKFLRFFHLEEEKNEPLRSDCDGKKNRQLFSIDNSDLKFLRCQHFLEPAKTEP